MTPAKLRFCGFTFSCNPRTLTIEQKRKLVTIHSPLCKSIIQDLGEAARIIKGEGALYGDDCYTQYRELSRLLSFDCTGTLYLPFCEPFKATLASLAITAKPQKDVLFYSFSFIENQNGGVGI